MSAQGAQYGGFWIRFLALLADSAIVFVVCLLLLAGAATALGAEAMTPATWLTWLVSFLYWPLMHASRRQATIGKALLGLRVTTLDGGRISLLRALGRELAKIPSSMILLVGFLMAAFTGRKQALHDLMASTLVSREPPARVVPALAIAVAGFAAPFFALPMILGGTALAVMESVMAQVNAPPPAPAPQVVKVAAAKPQPRPEPAVVTKPAPEAVPAPEAAPAPAITPVPVVAPAQNTVPAAEPAPKMVEPLEKQPKQVVAKANTKARPKPVASASQPTAPAVFEPKAVSRPKFNDLMTAVLYQDAEALETLLKLGKWPDKPDSRGQTPLAVAVELGDARSAQVLLSAGADARLALGAAEARRDEQMMSLLKKHTAR